MSWQDLRLNENCWFLAHK